MKSREATVFVFQFKEFLNDVLVWSLDPRLWERCATGVVNRVRGHCRVMCPLFRDSDKSLQISRAVAE